MFTPASISMRQQRVLHRSNTFHLILCGAALGCLSASVLYAVDAFIASRIAIGSKDPMPSEFEIVEMAIVGLFFSPAIETLIFQLLVFELTRTESRKSLRKSMIISTILFSLVHYVNGDLCQVGRMIFLGGMLSLGYAWARGKSITAAFCVTASAHTTHNALILSGFLFLSVK